MTTIVYKDGVLVSDSRGTVHTKAGGSRCQQNVQKLYRKKFKNGKEVVIATAGETYVGLAFVEWYGTNKSPPLVWMEWDGCDIDVLVLTEGGLFAYDNKGIAERILDPFWAIGSGAKAALGALHAGASASEAVRIACKVDPYSAGPLQVERL